MNTRTRVLVPTLVASTRVRVELVNKLQRSKQLMTDSGDPVNKVGITTVVFEFERREEGT